ncbi:MAG: sensor histidine kinase [Nannocystaceae bacterium]|nr:HAMP domain-containing histidine kinase [bacterium]
MNRRVKVWSVVALALLAVVGVMVSITSTLLDTERAAAKATAQAVGEERVRLALWRLDSTIPGRLSQEMARVALLAESPTPPPDMPSTPAVRGRFVRESDGTVRWLTPPRSPLLEAVEDAVASDGLMITLQQPALVDLPPGPGPSQEQERFRYDISQQSQSSREWAKRASTVRDNLNSIDSVQKQQNQALLNNLSTKVGSLGDLGVEAAPGNGYQQVAEVLEAEQASLASAQLGPVKPLWVGDELILARRVRRGEAVEIHGAWMDWPTLRDTLLSDVADLLPEPALTPITADQTQDTSRLLATLPVRLEHGALPLPPNEAFSPVRTSIIAGWTIVLLGTATVVGLLLWSMSLSERRAAFVSTVTHELRTPLTTFRMYTEMLGEKMVEAKRDRYIATLRSEADRLGHLVENVLSYARIESDRAERSRERLAAGTLIERIEPRLVERCEASGSRLELAVDDDSAHALVEVDPAAIEQILLNLVDNAAKYAPTDDGPARMVLETRTEVRFVRVAIRDHGPGIPASERRKVFEPFSKARADEAGTKPGVGLGLALCRRLARAHGGDLTVEDAKPGARFVLTLRRV